MPLVQGPLRRLKGNASGTRRACVCLTFWVVLCPTQTPSQHREQHTKSLLFSIYFGLSLHNQPRSTLERKNIVIPLRGIRKKTTTPGTASPRSNVLVAFFSANTCPRTLSSSRSTSRLKSKSVQSVKVSQSGSRSPSCSLGLSKTHLLPLKTQNNAARCTHQKSRPNALLTC